MDARRSGLCAALPHMLGTLLRSRVPFFCALAIFCLYTIRLLKDTTLELERFYCFGPAVSPMELSTDAHNLWHAHQMTPIIFNPHTPIEVTSPKVANIDLNPIKSSGNAAERNERVLILTPVRDAAKFLRKHFDLLLELTYPHELIDIAFLVGDTHDETYAILGAEADRAQRGRRAFRSINIVTKDFGIQDYNQNDVSERHGFEAQGPRRKSMGRARNYLLYTALKPDHSWVYWRDVDLQESPATILEDFMAHDKDVIVPNVWFHRYEDGVEIQGRFDYNSWQESPDALEMMKTLDRDVILAEGYKEYTTNRTYLALMGNLGAASNHTLLHEEVPLDGIGGVSILVKADLHRSGINFPCYAFENQAETEGFAKMAKRAGYEVVGLPNYIVWHVDTMEPEGNMVTAPTSTPVPES
ncbi:Anp1-domain-containing protein [Peziza echinospora]|nr:Anp1-domain-containing protein [Peziza echinospora]